MICMLICINYYCLLTEFLTCTARPNIGLLTPFVLTLVAFHDCGGFDTSCMLRVLLVTTSCLSFACLLLLGYVRCPIVIFCYLIVVGYLAFLFSQNFILYYV
ncbi:hypothetical protein CFOL_v3_27296 [Cephalotus follicularis]|uniref:Uncharacterized protein n=1 Tax=Cephalotus follicularis TaxID=3775 RepID=A0A1Q3CUP2_CEPFO|nr:hypothetical protein CFOL_v3_27296 [Cephalotus follicularis]